MMVLIIFITFAEGPPNTLYKPSKKILLFLLLCVNAVITVIIFIAVIISVDLLLFFLICVLDT